MNKTLFVSFLVIAASFACTSYHMMYTADTVANFLGYFISLAVLPALVGGIIGMTGIYALRKRVTGNIYEFWWLPTIGAVTSLILVGYVVLVMSMTEH